MEWAGCPEPFVTVYQNNTVTTQKTLIVKSGVKEGSSSLGSDLKS
jgi:hypothetical protein